jgi:hypothetical protein
MLNAGDALGLLFCAGIESKDVGLQSTGSAFNRTHSEFSYYSFTTIFSHLVLSTELLVICARGLLEWQASQRGDRRGKMCALPAAHLRWHDSGCSLASRRAIRTLHAQPQHTSAHSIPVPPIPVSLSFQVSCVSYALAQNPGTQSRVSPSDESIICCSC